MTLLPLQFRPGIMREGTRSSPEQVWRDCDKIRFRYGFPERIGGWEEYNRSSFVGIARSARAFVDLSGNQYVAFGTSSKYYIMSGQTPNDVTPIRKTTDPLGSNPITTGAAGSGTITITDTNHGAVMGDYVTIAGSTAVDGITTSQINKEQIVTAIINANSYTVDTGGSATSGSVSGGGSSVSATYQINVGLDTTVLGTGWGTDSWGSGAWGEASGFLEVSDRLRLWNEDNFGEDIVANIRDGGIYYWDASSGVSTRMTPLSSMAGADSGTPTIARKVIVSEEDRHLLCFACDPFDNIGTQDTLLVRWGDTESVTTWIPTTENAVGSFRLNQGSEIITALQTRQEILVFTDVSLHSVRYIGGVFVFGQKLIANNVNVIGPNVVIAAPDNFVYFMSNENFYVYDGRIKPMPCSVRSYVFGDINFTQRFKFHAGLNRGDHEIKWFYCSAASDEIDRYVVYNYQEQVWYYGTLSRTIWLDRSFEDYPLAAFTDGKFYFHEKGCDDGTTNPASAINAYIESAEIEPNGEPFNFGSRFLFVNRILPDITFAGSEASSPSVTMTVTPRRFPGSGNSTGGTTSATTTRTATSPIEQYTEQVHMRLRGRSVVYRIESNANGVMWRHGTPRVDIRPDGRK